MILEISDTFHIFEYLEIIHFRIYFSFFRKKEKKEKKKNEITKNKIEV